MNMESNTLSPPFIPTPQAVGLIHIGKWCVCVVNHYADDYSHKTLDYLPVQPVVQWAGADWGSAQAVLQTENARRLYGIREFLPPDISGMTASKTATLYIRLDRSQRYLAHLIGHSLVADSVEVHTVEQAVRWQQDWDQALAQYQHQTRALAWWQHCGLEEISEPGITERRRQPQCKPTMIQELEMIHELSEYGRHRNHSHAHHRCGYQRPRSPHSHG